MSHWILSKVITQWLSDGENMELQTNLLFLDSQGDEWYASKGSIINGASIPKIAWSFVGSPFVGKYRRASIIHDAYCQSKVVSSTKVHSVFYEIMIVDGVYPLKAFLMWLAVRLFGPQFKVDNDMSKYPANHPIWKIITHGTYGLLITLFLWLNASNFDHTEIKTILEIIAAMVGVEMIKKKLETKDSK